MSETSGEKIRSLLAAGENLKDAAEEITRHLDLDDAGYGMKADLDDLKDSQRVWDKAASVVDPTDYPC